MHVTGHLSLLEMLESYWKFVKSPGTRLTVPLFVVNVTDDFCSYEVFSICVLSHRWKASDS